MGDETYTGKVLDMEKPKELKKVTKKISKIKIDNEEEDING